MDHGRMAVWVAAAVGVLGLGAGAAHATSVLGEDAAGPVQAWMNQLPGLEIKAIRIQGSEVVADLPGGCTLHVGHPAAGICRRVMSVGNAVACFKGEGCPDLAQAEALFQQAGSLQLPWREGRAAPDDPRRAAMLEAFDRLNRLAFTGQDDELSELVLGLLQDPELRVTDWLSVMPFAGSLGRGADAWKLLSSDRAAALPVGPRAFLTVMVLMGPENAAAVARATFDGPAACDAAATAGAFMRTRRPLAALALAQAIRAEDAGCFPAWLVASHVLETLGRGDEQAALAEEAMKRFPDEPRLEEIETPWLLHQGKQDVVRKRLEDRVRNGAREGGLLKELFRFYIEAEGRKERLAGLLERIESRPDDLDRFLAGVMLHYEREYARSQALLETVREVYGPEPRLHIYLAMNAFNLGDREAAEEAIGRAEGLDALDPDVSYCVAEIYRDTDRKRALAALDRYHRMTEGTSDRSTAKEQRVQGMRDAIARCLAEGTPAPCPGPWEHTFDSVRLNREAEAAANKAWEEDQARDAARKAMMADPSFEGGAPGSGGAEADGGAPAAPAPAAPAPASPAPAPASPGE